MPSADDWQKKGLEKYGLIAASKSGESAQVEKVTFEQATELLATLPDVVSVGTSLGSFSVSAAMMNALMAEYAPELAAKQGKKVSTFPTTTSTPYRCTVMHTHFLCCCHCTWHASSDYARTTWHGVHTSEGAREARIGLRSNAVTR